MNLVIFFLVILCAATLAAAKQKLTPFASVTGVVVSVFLYLGLGWNGIALMATFFLLGTGATAWKKSQKSALGLKPENSSGRTAGQVLANGGVGGLLGLLALRFPQHESLLLLLTAAAFSSATADTLSSELGSVYGRCFFDILTFKNAPRGNDGVVSVEGFVAGAAGSFLIALAHAAAAGLSQALWLIVLAGTVGNVADSVLGATLERKGFLGNNGVNFLNTAVAAGFLFLLCELYAGLLIKM